MAVFSGRDSDSLPRIHGGPMSLSTIHSAFGDRHLDPNDDLHIIPYAASRRTSQQSEHSSKYQSQSDEEGLNNLLDPSVKTRRATKQLKSVHTGEQDAEELSDEEETQTKKSRKKIKGKEKDGKQKKKKKRGGHLKLLFAHLPLNLSLHLSVC